MMRKLTKKRPVSTPVIDSKAKGEPHPGNGPEILPDVLFHGTLYIAVSSCMELTLF